MITILSVIAAITVLAVLLVREIRADGYGHRPVPSSFEQWGSPGLPSEPPARLAR